MLYAKQIIIALAFSCASLSAFQPSMVARGPLFGKFCYWVVKGFGYGVPTTIATTTIGGTAALILPETVGSSANLALTALSGSETAALMGASQWSTAVGSVAAGFEGLPVVGFVTNAMPGAVTFTAGQAAQHAAAVTASMYAPAIVANTAVGAAAASVIPAASIPAATGGVVAGKAIIAAIGIEAAGAAVAAVTTAANGVGAYTVMVEGAALTAGALGTACPWLP